MEWFKKYFRKIIFFDSCEKIKLYNWVKYYETTDLRYFNSLFIDHKNNNDTMVKCFDDYLSISENHDIIIRFQKIDKLLKLECRYKSIELLCNCIINFPKYGDIKVFNDLIEALEGWNYKINRNKEVFEQIEQIKQRNKANELKINLLKDELDKEKTEKLLSIERQLLIVSKGLGLSFVLNQKKISLKQWVEYQKQFNLERENGK